jgi:hypothetical protein
MPDQLFKLFDEYAAAYARGERPSAENYLERAGAAREELASLLDEFLRRTPVRPPSEDDRRSLGLMLADEPPLLALRVEQGMRVDDMVVALVDQLGLEPAKRAKVKRYYQRLEGGLLDPLAISKRLHDVLANLLGAGAEVALRWTAPPAPASAFLRQAEHLHSIPTVAAPSAEARDEIDELFTGGG